MTISLLSSANTVSQYVAKTNEIINVGFGNTALTKTTLNARNSLTLGGQTIANTATIWTSANDGSGSGLDADTLDGLNSAAFVANSYLTGSIILTRLLTVDGSGSTLDADLLDGYDSAAFARLAGSPTFTTPLSLSYTNPILKLNTTASTQNTSIRFTTNNAVRWEIRKTNNAESGSDAGSNFVIARVSDAGVFTSAFTITRSSGAVTIASSTITAGGSTVWHAGNDGTGSGLDADTLDGLDSSAFVANSYLTGSIILTRLLTVDGAASGLDADLLDGQHGSYYAPLASPTFSGTTTFGGTVALNADMQYQTLSDGVTINWDTSIGKIATVTLGGNRTMAAPTNLKRGTYILHVIQDGTGGRTLTWNSVYKWTANVAPVLTTTGGRRDVFSFVSDGTNMYGTYAPNFW